MRDQMCQNVIQYEVNCVKSVIQYEMSNVSKCDTVWEGGQLCQKCDTVWDVKWVNFIQYESSTVSKVWCSMRDQLCQKWYAVWEVKCVKSVMQYERSPSLSPNTKILLNYCNAIKLAFSLKFKNRVYPMLSIILTIRYLDLPLTISYYRTYNQNCMSTVYLSDEWKHTNLSLKFLNIKGFNFEPIANRVWAKRTRLNLP